MRTTHGFRFSHRLFIGPGINVRSWYNFSFLWTNPNKTLRLFAHLISANRSSYLRWRSKNWKPDVMSCKTAVVFFFEVPFQPWNVNKKTVLSTGLYFNFFERMFSNHDNQGKVWFPCLLVPRCHREYKPKNFCNKCLDLKVFSIFGSCFWWFFWCFKLY